MQTFSKPQAAPVQGAMKHLALLDGAGAVLLHEELPASAAPLRRTMLCLQAELDARDLKEDRKVYMGDTWPLPEEAPA